MFMFQVCDSKLSEIKNRRLSNIQSRNYLFFSFESRTNNHFLKSTAICNGFQIVRIWVQKYKSSSLCWNPTMLFIQMQPISPVMPLAQTFCDSHLMEVPFYFVAVRVPWRWRMCSSVFPIWSTWHEGREESRWPAVFPERRQRRRVPSL